MRNILVKRPTDLLWAPREFRQSADLDHWPQCAICKHAVEALNMEHLGSQSCEFVVRCHGQYEARKIAWTLIDGEPPDDHEITKVLGNQVFFDPTFQVG